jgi:Asp-tRNA(Asn)/Glu-tRNA(Gln) amidotransferase A subunit family amidase
VLKLPPVPINQDLLAPRIGFCGTPIWKDASPDTQALLEKTARDLAAKGASVVDIEFGPAFNDILDDHAAITGFESFRNYADERLRNPGKLSPEITGVLKRGGAVTLERYVAAQRKTVAFKAHIDEMFDSVDVLLTPSAPGEAPHGLKETGDPRFNSIWTLSGNPCVTLPAGTGPKGLPLGVQLVGLRHDDDRLLSIAAWVAARLG